MRFLIMPVFTAHKMQHISPFSCSGLFSSHFAMTVRVRINPPFPFYTQMLIFMSDITVTTHSATGQAKMTLVGNEGRNVCGESEQFSCHDSFRHTDTIISCFSQPWPSLVTEHTLKWHNLHAWPCSSRTRHISLFQHTCKLLIFLSLRWNSSVYSLCRGRKTRSAVGLMWEGDCLPRWHQNKQCSPCAYRNTLQPLFQPFPDRIFPFPSCAQGWEESDMYSLYTSPVIKKLLGDLRGKPISLNHLYIYKKTCHNP